jgi:hypothetical protein
VTTTLWLRISSVITLLFAVGHTLGGRNNWSPTNDNPVILAMGVVRFQVMGVSRSYLDFYRGFGYLLAVAMVMQAVLLWQFATLARTSLAAVRPMIAIMVLAGVANVLICWRLIFPIPALFSLVLLASLIVSYVLAGRAPVRQPGAP